MFWRELFHVHCRPFNFAVCCCGVKVVCKIRYSFKKMALDADQYLRTIQREYLDFIDDDDDQGVYHERVSDMIRKGKCRIIVNINDLRRKNEKRATKLLTESFEELVAFQNALKEFVNSADTAYSQKFDEFFVGFEGSFGAKHVTPRSLSSRFLGNMVCVEGIVTKCSLVYPKVVKSVHYCPNTQKTLERRYSDLTSLNAFPSSSVYPTKDEDGNPLETEYGLSTFKDHQSFTIQEMPEKAPAGQLPRSVDIIVDNDLVDNCKPGDRVQIVGTFRCLPSKRGGFTSGTFRTVLIANNVQVSSKEVAPSYTANDVSKIKKFSRQHKDVFSVLAGSLAPSIHGHEYIKKAVLCLLLGGSEKVLENGTRLRGITSLIKRCAEQAENLLFPVNGAIIIEDIGLAGPNGLFLDINVLLIGDPSTAKSQMLRYVIHTAPRAIPTTGRGSSGVGLTAAVTTDQETGDRRLEAGAMVLADRGVVCIDEFDKMSDIDRTAIHEVMEQGRVTISKAGIHAKLNARCSVLAAANPVWGRYDQYKNPMDNIGMQDSLLSRFDLLFIVLDQMDPDNDRKISEHVLRMHRYRNPGEQDGEALPFGVACDTLATKDPDLENVQEETRVYEKHDRLLHGERRDKKARIVSLEFMRKYVHVAKFLKPALTREAADKIANQYTELRDQENISSGTAKTMPVTARTLETMIRLSTAHAKARLSKTVDKIDAEAAIDMVSFAYFHKVQTKEKRKRKASDEDDEESEEDDGDDTQESEASKTPKRVSKRRKAPRRKEGEEADPFDFDEEEEDAPGDVLDQIKQRRTKSTEDSQEPESMETEEGSEATELSKQTEPMSKERFEKFKSLLQGVFAATHVQSLPFSDAKTAIDKDMKEDKFTDQEMRSALDVMQEANQIMVSEKVIFLV